LPYEVVDDPAPDDTGFEVVDDAPTAAAPKAPAPPPKAKLATQAPPPPAKPKLAARRAEPDDEDDRPRPAKAKAVSRRDDRDDEGDEDRPRPKKKKKKKKDDEFDPLAEERERQAERDKALADFEFKWPLLLLAGGVILCFVGAFGASKVGAVVTLTVTTVGMVVTIPAMIAVLMVVGIFMGIEYGRIGPAVLKLAAISFVSNGIMFIGDWFHVPGFIVFPISCAISFGLFMTQFDLDTWEANVSVGALNAMAFVANMVLIGFLVLAAAKSDGGGGGGGGSGGGDDGGFVAPDDDDPPPPDAPQERRRGRDRDRGGQQPQPMAEPDDGDQ
jgi:hypothetical protein